MIAEEIAAGKRPTKMEADEQFVYDFARELIDTKGVGDATFSAVKDRFGERGVVDLIGLIGHYHTVSMLLNVDRYPLPEGTKPPLEALNRSPPTTAPGATAGLAPCATCRSHARDADRRWPAR